jgi:hypothetical protein
MDGVGRIGGPAVTRTARRAAGSGGFAVPAESGDPHGPAHAGAANAAAGLPGLLAVQEEAGDPSRQRRARDRAARAHAEALLAALAGLQQGLLGDGARGGAALARLSALAAGVPAAADPGLAALGRAVMLRARVELARAAVEGAASGTFPWQRTKP